MKIKILTATFNNGKLLISLYKSLINQSDLDFEWIIVDDGSTDDTNSIVTEFINKEIIKINYIFQINGGKSKAINNGLLQIDGDDFVLIVDADEELSQNAVSKVKEYVEKYKNDNVGVIHFNRFSKNTNKIISNNDLDEDKYFDYYQWKNENFFADGYIGYFGSRIKEENFPIFESEKYVGPSVLIMKVIKKYLMITAMEAIGSTEYQIGGITSQGRKLRLKNPKGSIYYCLQLQNKRCRRAVRYKYSILGYAYSYYTGLSLNQFYKSIDLKEKLNPILTFPGFLLSVFWKYKYNRK